jgi:acyl-coenzyme A synthetase/AMP-(fatty) acid ligase
MSLLGPIFEQEPDAVAFRGGDGSVTYRQLCEDIDTMAYWLAEKGVGPGKRIGIRFKGDHSYWTRIAILGAIRVGALHATVNNVEVLRKAVRSRVDPQLDFYLTANDPFPGLPASVQTLQLCPTSLKPLADQLGMEQRSWEDPATEQHAGRLAFTSGTTGKPQALLWNYELMVARIDQARTDVTPGTKLFLGVGLVTTAGFRYPIVAWQRGGTLLTWGLKDEVEHPSRVMPLMESNLIVTSPISLRRDLTLSTEHWLGQAERKIIVIGGRLPVAVRDEALRRACATVEVHYGATETGRTTMGDASVLDRHQGAVGFASDGATIEIVDAQDRPVPAGKVGIVRTRGPSMSSAYDVEGEKGAGSSFFRDGWFYPGDQGILYEDGLLAIAGRVTEAVNVGGVKVSLADVESKLSQIPAFQEACAVPVSLNRGDILAVVVVPAKGADRNKVQQQVRAALPTGCPFRIVPVRQLPRGAMGKVQRQRIADQLKALVAKRQASAGKRRAPAAA